MSAVTRDPVVRTALPLLVNVGSNGLLGIGYWMVAARLYDTQTVADNSAIIAAMTTLSAICQLNLGQGLAVLVPRSGKRARIVVLQAYGAVTAFALLVVAAFLTVVLPHLNDLSAALEGTGRVALFITGVLALNIFALQDSAMVALRLGRYVPVENTTYGVVKIVVLVLLVGVLPGFGIYASWVIPMLLLVPVVSGAVLWRRREPRRVSDILARQPSVPRLALDYVGYLFQVSSSFMYPVIALEVLDAKDAAVFSIAWLTSSTIDLLATQVGTALTVEASYGHDPAALRRTVLRKGLALIGLIAVVGIVVAPLVLSIYGHTYREHGVGTLRLLLLAGVSRSLITFTVAEARAHGNITFIVWLRAVTSTSAIVLAVVLAPRIGPEGMALAWLIAQTLGAAVVAHRLWSGRLPVAGAMA
ncbi:MAG: hypothetical protein QOK15_1128 [Nocardioidaceae bacterium]|jgi:O-antigen/teichoic acid export membrane protein|nr:hypothetical protein [Nocardioidaceae bacterium]